MVVVSITLSIGLFVIILLGEPVEILGILDRDVAILDDDHEDILDYGYDKEDEAVHEEDCVEIVGLLHAVVGVEQGVTSLHGEHGEESGREVPETLPVLPHHGGGEEGDTNQDG